MRVEQIDGKFYVIRGCSRKISEGFDTAAEANEELDDIEFQLAEEAEFYGDVREDTPCLQPEEFMSYHS